MRFDLLVLLLLTADWPTFKDDTQDNTGCTEERPSHKESQMIQTQRNVFVHSLLLIKFETLHYEAFIKRNLDFLKLMLSQNSAVQIRHVYPNCSTLFNSVFSVFSAAAAVFQRVEEANQGGSEREDMHGESQTAPRVQTPL